MSRSRRWLLLILLLGLAGNVGGAGTFASFSASTTNDGSTFATGTIVLSNKKNTDTACLSTGPNNTIGTGDGVTDDNDNTFACSSLINVNIRKPGDVATVDLTLQNVGTLDATNLRVHRSAACAQANAAGESYFGTGNMCTSLLFALQEYDDAARTDVGYCHVGAVTGADTLCTTSGTLNSFMTTYTGATTPAMLDLGPLNATATRYFRLIVDLPSTVGNTLQGRQATFGFTWRLDQ